MFAWLIVLGSGQVTTDPRSLFSYRDSTFLSIFAVPNNTVSLFLFLLLLLFSLNFSSGNEVIIQLQSTKEVINGNFIRCTIRFSCMHIRVAIAEVGYITDHGMVNAILISSPQMTESCRSCQCGHVFEDTKQIAGRRFSGMNSVSFPQ